MHISVTAITEAKIIHIVKLSQAFSLLLQKKRRCKIVVATTWFKESKIDKTNISNWRDYVDIFYFKQDTPYVTLDPNDEKLPEGLQLFVKKVRVQTEINRNGKTTQLGIIIYTSASSKEFRRQI